MTSEIRRGEIFPGFEITEADTLVDVGCGSGWASQAAGNLGADVIAIDVDRNSIDRLGETMRNVPARSFRGIVSVSETLPLPDGAASAIICTEVLEHVDAPDRFLAELARIGRPGRGMRSRYPIPYPKTSYGSSPPPGFGKSRSTSTSLDTNSSKAW